MIRGIGTDIVEVARIEKSLSKKGFQEKVFSENEIAYCQKMANPAVNFAGRFAAKEALVKALSEPYYFKFELNSVEVINDDVGKPEFVLGSDFMETYQLNPSSKVHVSISHSQTYATATVIIESI